MTPTEIAARRVAEALASPEYGPDLGGRDRLTIAWDEDGRILCADVPIERGPGGRFDVNDLIDRAALLVFGVREEQKGADLHARTMRWLRESPSRDLAGWADVIAAAEAWKATDAEVTVPAQHETWMGRPAAFKRAMWRVALGGPRGLVEAEHDDLAVAGAEVLRKAREGGAAPPP